MGTGVRDPREVDAHYNSGVINLSKGDYDTAIAEFSTVIDFNPQTTNAFYHRAQAYFAKGDYEKAIADYTQAILLNPRAVEAYRDRGNARHRLGDARGQSPICIKPLNLSRIRQQHNTFARKSQNGASVDDACF